MLAEMAARKWSVAKLARESGVTYDVIRELKRRPTSSTSADRARMIGAALGFSVDSLEDDAIPPDARELIDNYLSLTDPAHREKLQHEARFLVRQETGKDPKASDGS